MRSSKGRAATFVAVFAIGVALFGWTAWAAVDVKTYLNADRTTEREIFERGDTVYARATGLNSGRHYRFKVLDKNGVQKALGTCFTGVNSG